MLNLVIFILAGAVSFVNVSAANRNLDQFPKALFWIRFTRSMIFFESCTCRGSEKLDREVSSEGSGQGQGQAALLALR